MEKEIWKSLKEVEEYQRIDLSGVQNVRDCIKIPIYHWCHIYTCEYNTMEFDEERYANDFLASIRLFSRIDELGESGLSRLQLVNGKWWYQTYGIKYTWDKKIYIKYSPLY